MDMQAAIKILDASVPDPAAGLPEEVFRYISRMTPLVNVDLLIKDEQGRVLLAWRDDEFAGTGWHVPGGILRYKERLEERVQKVAVKEIGVTVKFKARPITFNQLFCAHDTRGHFIAFLYECSLGGSFIPNNSGRSEKDRGFLKWHEDCPTNLIKAHEIYRQYMLKNKNENK